MAKQSLATWFLFLLFLLGTPAFAQQQPPPSGVPVHMIVSAEALHGKDIPVIHKEDVVVRKGSERLPVTDWLPLQGEHAALDLFVLIDDSAESEKFGLYLNELRQFVNSQASTTAVGVGYLLNGTVSLAQNLTADHALAAKALRLPRGIIGVDPSPYLALSNLIKRWPAGPQRHEVLMLTSGTDRFGGSGAIDPYLDDAIKNSQCAGIVVYSIYTPSVGHFGHSSFRINWGQQYLAELSEETGGEAYYFLSAAAPVSFTPYLTDMAEHLQHQYLLTFSAKPEKKQSMQSVKLSTEVPNAELVAANKICVPPAP